MNASQMPLTALAKTSTSTPSPHERVTEPPPDSRGDVGCPREVAAHYQRMERRTRPPSSGSAGRRLKTRSIRLIVPEPEEHAVDVRRQRSTAGEGEEEGAPGRARRGARDRDPKLRPRARKHALELRHPTEEPESYPLDLHAVAAGLEGVPELVQEERGEEDETRDDRHRHGKRRRAAGVALREDAGERPGDQREDDQPAPVDAELDAGDPADRDAVSQVTPRPTGASATRGWLGRAASRTSGPAP